MIGSLGLFRQLAALGRAAPKGSAADLNKRVARLPEDAKARFKVIRAEQKAKIDAARAAAQTEFDKFLEDYGMPPRADYRTERKVVAAFVFGLSERGAGLETDGMTLRVNGREVAKRSSDPTDRYLKVCPGGFGEDRTSRRAANAALDILGAGVRVDDRDDRAFLRSSKGGGRGVVSTSACYTVDVTKKIRARAADALMSGALIGQSSLIPLRTAPLIGPVSPRKDQAAFVPTKSKAEQAEYLKKLRARRDARTKKALEEFATSGEFDGLGSMGRRRRKSRR
jgi:hypothetical protein